MVVDIDVILLILAASPTLAFLAFACGRRSVGRRVVSAEMDPFAALWFYQQALNDLGRDIDTLVGGTEGALSNVSRDDLYEARDRAYPWATYLAPASRHLVTRPSIPDLADTRFELIDVAHAYLRLSEQLADAIAQAQFPRGVRSGVSRRLAA